MKYFIRPCRLCQRPTPCKCPAVLNEPFVPVPSEVFVDDDEAPTLRMRYDEITKEYPK